MSRLRAVVCLGLVAFLFGVACSSVDRPPPAQAQTNTGPSDGSVVDGSDGATTTNPGTGGCYPDTASEIPHCSWKQVIDGDTRIITAQPGTSGGGLGPLLLEMTAVVPTAKVASAADCKALSMGFLLKATDMDETLQPDEGVYWYLVGADGKWRSAGNGGVSGLVAAFDPAEPTFDGGAPRKPTYQFDNHCDDLFNASDAVSLVTLMTVIHSIHVGKASYEADFAGTHAKDGALPYGYYFTISK